MSGPRGRANPLAPLGLDPETEAAYRVVLRHSGGPRGTLADALGVDAQQLDEMLAPLVTAGLVLMTGDYVHAPSPDVALGRMISEESRRLRAAHDELDDLRELIPVLGRTHVGEPSRTGERIDGEVVSGGDFPTLWMDLARHSQGEILHFRLDKGQLPSSPVLDVLARDLMAGGRKFRSLYPAAALSDVPDVLRRRAADGEEIRLVAALPTRMAVFGSTSVLVPQDWGVNNDRRLVIRQPSLVAAARYLFDQLWGRAVVVPGLPWSGLPSHEASRTLLLDRMALGEKDEQIARALGVSLRTVRRRIAGLQDELGVGSRFQAGVEAVRRGWI